MQPAKFDWNCFRETYFADFSTSNYAQILRELMKNSEILIAKLNLMAH